MLYRQVSDIMKNAEAKGEEGEVDEAQELFQQAEELQQKKAGLEAKALQVSLSMTPGPAVGSPAGVRTMGVEWWGGRGWCLLEANGWEKLGREHLRDASRRVFQTGGE